MKNYEILNLYSRKIYVTLYYIFIILIIIFIIKELYKFNIFSFDSIMSYADETVIKKSKKTKNIIKLIEIWENMPDIINNINYGKSIFFCIILFLIWANYVYE